MRHQKRGRKLSRSTSHRKAMLSNMAASLLIHKQIKTTEAKAKEVRRLVDRLITYGKKEGTHARRLAFATLRNKEATRTLFEDIAPLYANRQGGYTRIIKLGYRPNDTAKVVLLQLVDFFGEELKKDKKKTATKDGSKKPEKAKKSGKTSPDKAAEKQEGESKEKDPSAGKVKKAAEKKTEKTTGSGQTGKKESKSPEDPEETK